MRSNYKRLGNYIQPVNNRNNNLDELPLLGVSIQKVLMPSIANTIGTDMSTYKLIEKNQFAYGAVTSRNGDKISIALLYEFDKALVSQAYTVFEIIDTKELLPEYLMMWFSRPEFDRFARYHSYGSARETFDWQEMIEVLLPVPSPTKQQEIINEYHTITNRIKINEQLIQKLDETAQAIYKEWFVDFDFPNKEGKPYKSSGGEMVESVLGLIPKGWRVGILNDIIEITSGKTPNEKIDLKDNIFKNPIYGAGGIMGYSNEFLFNEKLLSIGRVGTHGVVQRINFPCWTSDNTLVIKSKYYEYVNQILNNINYDEINRGGVQGLITQTDIKNHITIIPTESISVNFEIALQKIMILADFKKIDIEKTDELRDLLLAKLATIEN